MCIVRFSIDNLLPFSILFETRDISRPNDKKTRRISRSRRRVVRYLVRDAKWDISCEQYLKRLEKN